MITVGELEKVLAKVKNKNAVVLACEADPTHEFDNGGLEVSTPNDLDCSNSPFYLLVNGIEE